MKGNQNRLMYTHRSTIIQKLRGCLLMAIVCSRIALLSVKLIQCGTIKFSENTTRTLTTAIERDISLFSDAVKTVNQTRKVYIQISCKQTQWKPPSS
jgi:hypothetical protein